MSDCEPGAGEARLTVELDGHIWHTRGLAIGSGKPAERVRKVLPGLVRLMDEALERVAEKRKPSVRTRRPSK